MDRRQLLFGVTALGLASNLKFRHPLISQVADSTGAIAVSPTGSGTACTARSRNAVNSSLMKLNR
jgi:hypothetical protein